MAKSIFLPALAVFALALCSPAAAQTQIFCEGTLNGLYIDDTGSVVLQGTWNQNWTQICKINQTWKGITPEVCAFWAGLMATSKTNSKTVRVSYITTYTCTSLPTYANTPAPFYVMQL